MSNVLVIHPSDKSTDFLKKVYEGKGYDVINDCRISEFDLLYEIVHHDKIIMMGHGTPAGLINPEYFGKNFFSKRYESRVYEPLRPYIIDDRFAPFLADKETISIWCNSDKYYEHNNLSDGNLHTGMIISEVAEEMYILKDVPLDEEEILENMNLFAEAIHDSLDMEPEEMIKNILSIYDGDDDVTLYNRENIKLI